MSEPVCKDIQALRPEAAAVCAYWLRLLMAYLKVDVRVTETRRSRARQAELQHQGASDVSLGWHNVGLAWDFAIFDNNQYVADGSDWRYQLCGLVGKALGCKYPITLANGQQDRDHLEFRPEWKSLQEFLAAHPDEGNS